MNYINDKISFKIIYYVLRDAQYRFSYVIINKHLLFIIEFKYVH